MSARVKRMLANTSSLPESFSVAATRSAQPASLVTSSGGKFEVPAGPCPMLSTYRQGDPQPQPYYPSVGDGEVELFVRPSDLFGFAPGVAE